MSEWVTCKVGYDLKKRMQSHKEINWSEIMRQAIIKKLEESEN